MTNFDRRSFLSRGALLAGATVMGPAAFTAITAGAAGASEGIGRGRGRRIAGDYGPLAPVPAVNEPGSAYLALPDGFSYVVFGKIGSPMTDTNPTPVNLDGMAAFAGPDGTVRLIRNHEDRSAPGAGSVLGPVSAKYDPLGGGGTTSLDFNLASRTLVRDFISLNGTIVNCAGGIVTIEGKTGWMTSEETTAGPPTWAQKHGYNFFVPVDATGPVKAEPYRAMGRFAHEAVIREDRTGIFYQTEDAGSGRGSGFYRYLPTTPDARAGRLQMLAIKNQPQADLREGQRQFKPLPVEWVNIPNPDPADPIVQADKPNPTSVFAQGFAAGGAKFNRLEGIWDGGSSVFFASTSGGDAKNGDVNSDGFREATGRSGSTGPGATPSVSSSSCSSPPARTCSTHPTTCWSPPVAASCSARTTPAAATTTPTRSLPASPTSTGSSASRSAATPSSSPSTGSTTASSPAPASAPTPARSSSTSSGTGPPAAG